VPLTPPITLRVVRSDGAEVLALAADPDTFVLNNLDLGYPTVRAATEVLPGADGEIDTTAFFGGRAVTAEVTVGRRDPDGLVDRLAGVMHPGARHWLYIGCGGWAGERRILGRAASFSPPGGVQRRAQLGFHCPSGLLEDAVEQSVTLAPQGSPAGGMAFPVSAPMAFDPGLVPGAALIDVGGSVPVPPVIDVYGPCSDPLVRVVDTGAQVILRGDIAEGDFVRIDVAARTILRNNDPNYSLYGRLDFAASSWPVLPVGQVQVVFSPQSSSGACQAVVRWANRWL
jgi:hypothetical protein